MRTDRAAGLVTSNVRPLGTERDQCRFMIAALLHVITLSASMACQQAERRESAGEVAATLPPHPAPVPTPDADLRAAQVDLAEGRAWLATKRVAPILRSPARKT